ncbi:FIG026765: hypothetical protein [invertebrate metagenome]|uniref:Cell division protein ZapA n=1 Tax=invertebrate metagenome TaxID=1711999 RepID=A0A484H5P5_9ZZZZ
MGQVSVTISGRIYRVACDDGQENRVTELGDYLDRKACELARVVGHIGESLLLVLAGLVVVDELWECQRALEDIQQERDQMRRVERPIGEGSDTEEEMAIHIERLAKRIECIAERLESCGRAVT